MTRNCINTMNPVLQVVTASTGSLVTLSTALPYDDTIPQNTEGDEIITATITPKYATSLLEISFYAGMLYLGGAYGGVALFQDSTANALAAKVFFTQHSPDTTMIYYMVSGTTSPTTFKIRGGKPSGTGYCNGASGARKYGGACSTILKIVEYLQ